MSRGSPLPKKKLDPAAYLSDLDTQRKFKLAVGRAEAGLPSKGFLASKDRYTDAKDRQNMGTAPTVGTQNTGGLSPTFINNWQNNPTPRPTNPVVGSPPVGSGGSAVGTVAPPIDPMDAINASIAATIAAKYDPQKLQVEQTKARLAEQLKLQQDAEKQYGEKISNRTQELYNMFGIDFNKITDSAIAYNDQARQRIAGGNNTETGIVDALLTSRANSMSEAQAGLPRAQQVLQGQISEQILGQLAGLTRQYNTSVGEQEDKLGVLESSRQSEFQALIAQAVADQQERDRQDARNVADRASRGRSSSNSNLIQLPNGQVIDKEVADLYIKLGQNPLTGEALLPSGVQNSMAQSEIDRQTQMLGDSDLYTMISGTNGLDFNEVPGWLNNNRTAQIEGSGVKLTPQQEAAIYAQNNIAARKRAIQMAKEKKSGFADVPNEIMRQLLAAEKKYGN